MSLETLLSTDSVTIRTPGSTTTAYGDSVPDWASVTDTATTGWIHQRTADERLGYRDAELSDWVLFLRVTETVTAQDRVVYGALVLEVAGPITTAHTPACAHHLEVPLRLVEG